MGLLSMAKVLLKHVSSKPNKSYQRDIARITKVTISVRSVYAPKIEMYSSRELSSKEKKHAGNVKVETAAIK